MPRLLFTALFSINGAAFTVASGRIGHSDIGPENTGGAMELACRATVSPEMEVMGVYQD
jgi:hypothetical protein